MRNPYAVLNTINPARRAQHDQQGPARLNVSDRKGVVRVAKGEG